MDEVAYIGHAKRIIWAADSSGRRHGQEYRRGLSTADQAKIDALLQRMGDEGRIFNIERFRHEGDGIYCFKKGLHRLPTFFDGDDVVITHGFKKTHPKMPRNEKERALRVRREYQERGGYRHA